MDNFIVSARKYRPDTFKSVVGQASITTTLKNAISKNHLAHAYLFFGPRGVGKTTCARIFAKTINCDHITADHEACNECISCKSFIESRSYNIHELDAASNNSVDDIRNLTDQVRIPPQIGKYSIYIIDEVHMLSTSAFNAFLKTLEEPPAHAIFILATTEKHKIIPTILSRCQIFDFNRIEVNDIVNHLEFISKEEGIKADKNGLNVIAQKADGAMRDALSIFDQIVSFSGNEITYNSVLENLNVLDYEYYFKIVDAFHKSDYSSALILLNEILNKGFDGQNFISGLSKHLRDVLVCQDLVTIKLLEVGADIREKYKEQAVRCEADFLLQALDITNKFDLGYKVSNNKRLHIEIALLQLSLIQKKKNDIVAPNIVIEEEKVVEKPKHVKVDPVTKPIHESVIEKKEDIKADPVPTISDAISSVKKEKEIIAQEEEPKIEVEKKKPVSQKKAKQDSDYIPSIKDALNVLSEPESTSKNEDPEDQYNANATGKIQPEELKKAWKEIADYYRVEQLRVATIIENNEPIIKDDNILLLKLSNHSQRNHINEIKPYAIPFLRERFDLSFLKIEIEVEELAEDDSTPYTQEERIKYMSEKYPMFGQFKDKFKLDYD